jgi:ankyrin repeat protein
MLVIALLSACSTSAPAKPVTVESRTMDGQPYTMTGFDAMLHAVIVNNKAAARALLEEGSFDVNLVMAGGDAWTLLHVAAQYDRREIGELLLKHGAGVNLRNRGGRTPLGVALANQHPEMAALLQKGGGTE